MKKILTFYYGHKKIILTALSLLAAFAFFYVSPFALAVTETKAAAPADPGITEALKTANAAFNIILRSASMLLWPVVLAIGSLLDNEIILGGAMGERLLSVWVQVRNIVNIIFVFVLLGIAIYNVLGLGDSAGGFEFGLKAVLPKFVLALLAVNFSMLGAKVVLDFTNVITGAVFALPVNTAIEENFEKEMQSQICGANSDEAPLKPLFCDGPTFNEKAKTFFSKFDRTNVAVAYAIKFGKAIQLKNIKDGIKDLSQLGFNIIFNTVLFVVYALSYIALFLVLLTRIVVLWVAVVLSPLIMLTIVLPNLKELAGAGGELKDKVMASLIAPITIGFVMSLGYIMLDAFNADPSIHGAILSSNSLQALDPFSLPTAINDVQQLMISVAMVVIIWMGVFGAASKTVASGMTDWIKTNAQGLGKWVAKLPTYAPLIPMGSAGQKMFGKSHASLAEMMATSRDIAGEPERQRGRSLWRPTSAEELQPWNDFKRNASGPQGMEKLAKAIKDSPRVLQKPEGFEILKDGLTAAGLSNLVGKDYKETIDKLFAATSQKAVDFRAALLRQNSTWIDATAVNGFIAAAQAPTPPAARDADAINKAAGSAKDGDALKKDPAFANDSAWTVPQLEALRTMDNDLRKILLEVQSDGKVKLFDVTQANTLKTELQKLTAASRTTDVTAALSKMPGLTKDKQKELITQYAPNVPEVEVTAALNKP